MNQLTTHAIVLARINYGEADRILTLLTPEYGKLRLIAKGVRRAKSKLAGGIELFSVSEIVFIKGKGDIGTLTSSRLRTHYGGIVKDINRTMLTYELIKQLNKATEDECEGAYFDLLQQTFVSLENTEISMKLTQIWFASQLLALAGRAPNLETDSKGIKLSNERAYSFSFEEMAFNPANGGKFTSGHIKLLRLLVSGTSSLALTRIQNIQQLVEQTSPLIEAMRKQSLGV